MYSRIPTGSGVDLTTWDDGRGEEGGEGGGRGEGGREGGRRDDDEGRTTRGN